MVLYIQYTVFKLFLYLYFGCKSSAVVVKYGCKYIMDVSSILFKNIMLVTSITPEQQEQTEEEYIRLFV